MPLWNNTETIKTLRSSIPVEIMTATVMTDGQETEAVALPPSPDGKGLDIAFEVLFGATPTTVDFQLQVAFDNVDAEFFDKGSSMTATAGGITVVSNIVARFARVIANDADVKAVTINIMYQ